MTAKALAPKTTTYHAHRERQQKRILEAARDLFDKNGIEPVTMAEITSASGLRASTMYQYFSNKDDLLWAIAGEMMEAAVKEISRAVEDAPNALARITCLLEFMANQLMKNRSEARFMAEFDAIYSRSWPAERLLALESRISPEGFHAFSRMIRDGIADGTLRTDLDPDLTMHAIVNAVIGAQRRLASLGSKVEVEYGQPIDRLFRESIRVILLGLRAPQTVKPKKSGSGKSSPQKSKPAKSDPQKSDSRSKARKTAAKRSTK